MRRVVRQALVEHRAEPDLQVRRPVGGQRPPAARRAVRARRQQLHPRLPRAGAARRAADAHRLDRPERPLGRAERVHPAGQQPDVQLELLPAGRAGRRPRVQVRRLLAATRTRTSISHTGGFATVRFPTRDRPNDCSLAATGCQVDLTRDGYSRVRPAELRRPTRRTRSRTAARRCSSGSATTTTTTGAGAASIAANPLGGRWLPAIDFPGADPGVAFNNFSPRLGLTYDLTGNGKTIARANYARYFGQVGTGGVAGQSTRSARRRCGIRGSTLNKQRLRGGQRNHAERQPAVGQHELVRGEPRATPSRRTRSTRT